MICELLSFVKTSVSSLFFTGKKYKFHSRSPEAGGLKLPPHPAPPCHTHSSVLSKGTRHSASPEGCLCALGLRCCLLAIQGLVQRLPSLWRFAQLPWVSSPFPSVTASVISVTWSYLPDIPLSPSHNGSEALGWKERTSFLTSGLGATVMGQGPQEGALKWFVFYGLAAQW